MADPLEDNGVYSDRHTEPPKFDEKTKELQEALLSPIENDYLPLTGEELGALRGGWQPYNSTDFCLAVDPVRSLFFGVANVPLPEEACVLVAAFFPRTPETHETTFQPHDGPTREPVGEPDALYLLAPTSSSPGGGSVADDLASLAGGRMVLHPY
jgi:hypothetical protein